MRILYITNMFPDKKSPCYGIFIKEQIETIMKYHSIDYDIYFIDGRKNKWNYIKSISKIHNMILHNKYDLIHIHYGLAGLFLLKKMRNKIPVVITLHGGDIQKTQKKYIQVFLTKKILKKIDFAITLNDKMNDEVKQFVARTEVIPCSIDTELFIPPVNRSRNTPLKVIFPSSKERIEKNYSLFKEVLNLYKQKYSIDLQCIELNKKSRQQVVELFQIADVMLMTSYSEGSPQVVKEAMACNLPVISTKVGDVDYLLNGVKGSSVVDNKATSLSEALFLSLNGQISGIEGRERLIELGLDDKTIASRIYSLYKSLIKI